MAEKLIYDTGALYEQHMSDEAQRTFEAFYKKLFADYPIKTIHDCSVGAGGTTIPLAKLGYTVSGSDLSENLLGRAKLNFERFGFSPDLFIADFREIGGRLKENVDCVISTGNSLPHVNLDGFRAFLSSVSKRLNDGGLLFFDIRNWDTIVAEKSIMYAVDPKVMTAREHRSVYLLYNWHDDGSVTFSFAASVDLDGKHVSLDIIPCPPYYPLLRGNIASCLAEYGYDLIEYVDIDAIWLAKGMEKEKAGDFETDYANIQWYGVLARYRATTNA